MKALFEAPRVEGLLSREFGTQVEITKLERLAPWFAVRCAIASEADDVPTSVIVKVQRDTGRSDPMHVCTERAALEFVDELGDRLAPWLLASDLKEGILVLEDLAPCISLAEILKKNNARLAREGLLAFARALGTLHSVSLGHETSYYARRRALGPVDPEADRTESIERKWSDACAWMESFGASTSAETEADLAKALATLTEPGPFLAFSNGDSEANNYMLHGGDGRLIDFEQAGYRSALKDVVCLYVPGPMWVTVSDPVADGIETVYRSELSHAVPQAEDDRCYGYALAAACLVWAIVRLRLPKLLTRPEGDLSRVQMVSTLESAARVAETHRSLPHLSGWALMVASMLRRVWPDADVDLGAFPGYTPRWD